MQILYGPPGDAARSDYFQSSIVEAPFERNARTLYLVPSHRKRQHILARFSAEGGGVPPVLMTFNELAGDIARRTGLRTTLCSSKFPGIWKQFVLTDAAAQITDENLPVTVGLIHDAARHITELKKAGLLPDDLAAVPDAFDGFGGTLITLYQAYESYLETRHLTDPEGLLLETVTILNDPDRSPELPWTRIIADGFMEFTEPQRQILAALSTQLDTTLIWPGLPGANTVFAFGETALRMAFPDADWEPLDSESSDEPLINLARRFAGADIPNDLHTGSLRFMPSESIRNEVESIARDIKHRLKDAETGDSHLKPGDICVTFPDLAVYGPLVRRIFRRYGIPVNISQSLPLTASPLYSTITEILNTPPLYRRSGLLALFRDPLVDLPGPNAPQLTLSRVDQLTRELKTRSGPDRWRQRIHHELQKVPDSASGREQGHLLADFLETLESLMHILDTLTEPRTFPEYFDVVIQVLEKLGVRTCLQRLANESQANPMDQDRTHEYAIRAYGAFLEFRDEFRRMRSPDFLSGIMTLNEFRALLPRIFQNITYQLTTMAEERVQVLGRLENRGLTFRHLYLGGLTDQAFPSPEPPSSFWPPQLRTLLLDLPPDAAHSQAMTDMYRILLTPTETLTLSRPVKHDDEELLPGQIWIRLNELLPENTHYRPPESSVSTGDDLKKRAGGLILEMPARWPAEPGYDNLIHAAAALGEFAHKQPWQHGQIRPELLVARAAAMFQENQILSVSRVERCVQCPRRFFYEAILGLEPPEDPTEELDNMELGTLIHDTLHRFYQERIDAGLGKVTLAEIEPAAARIRAIATELFQQEELQSVFARRDLDGITGGGSHGGIARAFAETEAELPEELTPFLLEWSFGMRDNPVPLSIPGPGEPPVLIRGKLDRADRAGEEVVVYDYKSGQPPRITDVLDLKIIQIGIYMLALRILENFNVTTGCYYSVSPRKGVKNAPVLRNTESGVPLKLKTSVDPDEFDEYFEALQSIIGQTVSDARKGFFPALPDEKICGYCPFPNLCRTPQEDDDNE